MKFNFDEAVNRKNTNSVKHDFAVERGKPEGLIPLWVADMDFKTVPEVTEALYRTAEHSVFGYTEVKLDYFEAIKNWFISKFSFEIKPDWLVKTPGVVYSLCMAIRAFTESSDSILIQTPVYPPFKESIVSNGRKVVFNPLRYLNGRYSIDLDDFERKIVENNVAMFILCSPHNPVGRVWTQNELIGMGDICLKHKVIVLSDEIHCDFIYKGNKHFVFASLKDEYLNNSIICTSPSKTFNLAGLQAANTFIANEELRDKYKLEIHKTGLSQLNVMGLVSCRSAYEYGAEWLDSLNEYLTKNLNYISGFISSYLPQIKLVVPEGTYLIWLDLNALGLSEAELDDLLINKAGLWVNNGTLFGEEGRGFIRINIACPLDVIKKAFNQLRDAIPENVGKN